MKLKGDYYERAANYMKQELDNLAEQGKEARKLFERAHEQYTRFTHTGHLEDAKEFARIRG